MLDITTSRETLLIEFLSFQRVILIELLRKIFCFINVPKVYESKLRGNFVQIEEFWICLFFAVIMFFCEILCLWLVCFIISFLFKFHHHNSQYPKKLPHRYICSFECLVSITLHNYLAAFQSNLYPKLQKRGKRKRKVVELCVCVCVLFVICFFFVVHGCGYCSIGVCRKLGVW